jgi:hypothetical protein
MNNGHIGMKVVCVNDSPLPGHRWRPGEAPALNQVYTISGIHVDDDGDVVFNLQEICRHPDSILEWEDKNLGYGAHRFRPLRITDISIFTAMLAPRIKERA